MQLQARNKKHKLNLRALFSLRTAWDVKRLDTLDSFDGRCNAIKDRYAAKTSVNRIVLSKLASNALTTA